MLKPADIDNYVFKKTRLGGYDVDSVEDFMEQLSEDYETVYKELDEYKDKANLLSQELEESRNFVPEIKQEVKEEVCVEKTATIPADEIEAIKNNALIEAEEIIKKATELSKESVKEVEQQIKEKEKEFDDLKKEVQMFKIKFEAMLQTQLKILKTPETK
ncbi:MAG: DivIVA domain-containing protein [Clostridia bacterium]